MPRRRVLVALAAAAVLLVLGSGLWWLLGWLGRPTPLGTALGLLPEHTLRAAYTDWAAARDEVGDPGPDPSRAEVRRFLDGVYDRGLASGSALEATTELLADLYGVSPLDAEWEVYGQAEDGSVALVSVADEAELDDLVRNLDDLGYAPPPGGAGSDGVWEASADHLASIDPSLTPVQQNIAVVRDRRLVVMSDDAGYAERAVRVVEGDSGSLADVSGFADLTDVPGVPVSATLWAADFACQDLSMGDASPGDQERADRLVTEAGGVSPLSGLLMAQRDDGSMAVRMWFEDADQARADLQPRVDLASGAAPGQGGTFAERFRVSEAEADGRLVSMVLAPVGRQRLLSDLSQGPVLFATC